MGAVIWLLVLACFGLLIVGLIKPTKVLPARWRADAPEGVSGLGFDCSFSGDPAAEAPATPAAFTSRNRSSRNSRAGGPLTPP